MTRLLGEALSEIEKLPSESQDAIAAQILEQLADDRAWEDSFARSQDVLERLAEKARADVAAGRFRKLKGREG